MTIHKTPLFVALATALCSMSVQAADWSDTSISYRYGAHFREPANPSDISKDIVALTHVSGFKYGSNFFNVDLLRSDSKDPASNGGGGAQEVYVVYSNQLHLSKITGQKYAMGPISDFALSTGFDFSSKDDAFAARVRKFMIGPTVKFGGSLGWADLSVLYYKEKNHNGIVGTSVDFSSTYRIAAAWGTNFDLGPVPLQFNGFATYTGSKGRDGFGDKTGP
ncbi:hypothetical protein, partial [Uliginosibacterium gangwonense]|uniref:hypothetical protein n=1 Tax=Uliginosibacterium gangwonense TaxID=392736 RepID=UPI000378450B